MRSPSPAARRAAVALAATLSLAIACPAASTTAWASADAAPSPASAAGAPSESGYAQSITDRDPSGYAVGWGDLYKDESYDGAPLSLLVDGREREFGRGVFAHAPSTICYNDVQDWGYETFEAWVGLGASARVANKSAAVRFKVVGDGEVLWESPVMTERSDAERVSVDISDVHVLQLVAEATDKAAHPNNHAVWADASFGKAEASPWLSAADKEFSIPDQVTPENILEGVFARTLSGEPGPTDQPVKGKDGTLRNGREGNDLSDEVTYTTDYVPGRTGTFSITYRVADAQGIERSRTVSMTVEGLERTRLDADIDYLTEPFASFLYTGRDYFDEQGRAAFDLVVDKLLSFGRDVDDYPLVTDSRESVYRVDIDLQAAGIFMSTSDAAYLTSTVLDDEPRCFHVKDWGTRVQSRDGMAGTVTFFVPERYGARDASGEVYYHSRLRATEANATRFLSGQQDGMTDAQRLRSVLYPYADWIRYEGGQMMDEALADGKSVCGGNARGSVYLCQRMGIKAYWVRTNSHAWSNVKLNHDDSGLSQGAYYRIDLLARPGCFLSIDAEHEGFHGHHKEIFFNRAKGYPDMVSQSYPFAWTAWPSISLETEESITVLAPGDADAFDPMDLVASASSIYQDGIIDRVAYDDGGLEAKRTEDGFAPGFYTITFSVSDDRGNTAESTSHVQVVGGDVAAAGDLDVTSNNGATFEGVSLWNGREEVPYAQGIRQNDNKSTTFDIEGRGFTHFDAWVGINGTVRQNTAWGSNGKILPEVWATVRHEDGSTEEVNLYTGPTMGWYAVQEHVLVAIPEGAVALTLKNTDVGHGNSHAGWGNPRFFTGEVLDRIPVPPVISGIEDGAIYREAVTPAVEGASAASLWRKELPVVVDTETGLPVSSPEQASRIAADPSWGDQVTGWSAGDEVSEEGVYTLAAENDFGQQTVMRFTIDHDGDGTAKPDDGVVPGPGPDQGGTTDPDGGTTDPDGGDNSDGGTTDPDEGGDSDGGGNSDGGTTDPDGDGNDPDGGTTDPDGGGDSDGGTTDPDGGTTDPDGGGNDSDDGDSDGGATDPDDGSDPDEEGDSDGGTARDESPAGEGRADGGSAGGGTGRLAQTGDSGALPMALAALAAGGVAVAAGSRMRSARH